MLKSTAARSTRNRQIRNQQFYSTKGALPENKSSETMEHRHDVCAPNGHIARWSGNGLQTRSVHRLRSYVPLSANAIRLPVVTFVATFATFTGVPSSLATTKGLSQIVTPDLQSEGDFSLSFQIQDKRIANPYQLQAELGLTEWAEVAVFRGFQPDEWIFGTEIGVLRKEPYLLSIGFVNWSPHLDEDPQPFIEAGYWGEHHKIAVGAIHAGYKNEAILGYAYDFNETWRVQVDWQSGSENSSTIGFTCNLTRDFQFNPALYVSNGSKHDLFGYIVFTYTFHLWGDKQVERVVRNALPK